MLPVCEALRLTAISVQRRGSLAGYLHCAHPEYILKTSIRELHANSHVLDVCVMIPCTESHPVSTESDPWLRYGLIALALYQNWFSNKHLLVDAVQMNNLKPKPRTLKISHGVFRVCESGHELIWGAHATLCAAGPNVPKPAF